MHQKGINTPSAPVKMLLSNQMLSLKNWFKMILILIFKINCLENFILFIIFLNLHFYLWKNEQEFLWINCTEHF